ncbi:MAG: T9SS type A sorting domain-containing protein [Bacteroidales bacterium]|nr:T9SS type A sorting domain-containing protein [Bacteroidales bacterium]
MKKSTLIFTGITIILYFFMSSFSFAQTGSYSCNVIYSDQEDYAITGMQVDLFDSNDELIGTSYTGDDGFFNFDNLVIGESYTAKFAYDVDLDYVDLEDAISLLFYLFGIIEYNDLQLLSADVDASGSINFTDFVYILYYYYVNEVPFPAGEWALPDWEFEMTAGKVSGGPASVVTIGDLTGNDAGKNEQSIHTDYNDLMSFNSNEIVVPIYLNENMTTTGVGLVLGYNSNLIEVVSIESPIKGLSYNIKSDEIRMGWADIEHTYSHTQEEPIVKIHIKQNRLLANSQIEKFEILEETQIFDKSGKRYPFINFTSSEFKLSSAQIYNSFSNTAYPNPCQDYFTIPIDEENISSADVQIFNALGQLVSMENMNITNQKLRIDTQNLKSGTYYYHINIQSILISGTISVRN